MYVHKFKAKLENKSYKVQKSSNCRDLYNKTAKKRALKVYNETLTNFSERVSQSEETKVKADLQQMSGQEFLFKVAGPFVSK